MGHIIPLEVTQPLKGMNVMANGLVETLYYPCIYARFFARIESCSSRHDRIYILKALAVNLLSDSIKITFAMTD